MTLLQTNRIEKDPSEPYRNDTSGRTGHQELVEPRVRGSTTDVRSTINGLENADQVAKKHEVASEYVSNIVPILAKHSVR